MEGCLAYNQDLVNVSRYFYHLILCQVSMLSISHVSYRLLLKIDTIIPILQMNKLKFTEDRYIVHSHTVCKGQNERLNEDSQTSKSLLLTFY